MKKKSIVIAVVIVSAVFALLLLGKFISNLQVTPYYVYSEYYVTPDNLQIMRSIHLEEGDTGLWSLIVPVKNYSHIQTQHISMQLMFSYRTTESRSQQDAASHCNTTITLLIPDLAPGQMWEGVAIPAQHPERGAVCDCFAGQCAGSVNISLFPSDETSIPQSMGIHTEIVYFWDRVGNAQTYGFDLGEL